VTEVTFLTNHNNNLNWPNTSTHNVCWRRHEYYQLPLNVATQNRSVLSPNSTFRQYFIYFIVRKVNLKLVLSWNTGYFIRYAWGNHLCNFWFGKVKWFGIYGGLNFGFSHWNGWSSYLAAYDFTWTDSLHCTNIQPLFWYRLLKFRQLLLLSLKWLSTSCHCSRQ